MTIKKFIGRQDELKRLKGIHQQHSANFVVVRGRRRIGKSSFIKEFSKNNFAIKFSGLPPEPKMTAQNQRDHFADQLQNQLNLPRPDTSNWYNLFIYLASHVQKKHTIIVLDEISWMGDSDATFLPKLKDVWDSHFSQKNNLTFIVCGSVSSWIEKNILSSTGFFGRVSEVITLKELTFSEAIQCIEANGFNGSDFEKLILLSISGGVPWYIELIAQTSSLSDSINRLCFREDGILVNEFDRIFNDLFGSRSNTYQNIISYLSLGPKEHNEIAEGIAYSRSGLLSEYLDDLVLSGFLAKDTSWSFKTGLDKKISLYRLKDNYLRFYMKVILPNRSRIKRDTFQNQSYFKMPVFNSISGLQFENLIVWNKSLVYKSLNLLPQDILAASPYCQRATKRIKGAQIDLLIQTTLKHIYVIEIKFSQNSITKKVTQEVKDKIEALDIPKGYAISPVLIYFGELADSVIETDYFLKCIDIKEWF